MNCSASSIKIKSYKHNGQLHRVWHENVILKHTDQMIIGVNDQTMVTESDGSKWKTKIPAIVCFYADYWFNIVAMIKANGIHYYCNLSSPYTIDHEAIRYIDYDLDVTVSPDKTIRLLDEDEYATHQHQLQYPDELDGILHHHKSYLYEWIKYELDPFSPEFVYHWYHYYLQKK